MNAEEIILYHYQIRDNESTAAMRSLISSLSVIDQKHIYSIQNKEAQKKTLFGRIILKYIAAGLGIHESDFIGITNTGKPFFRNQDSIDFNISHSGDFVVCCVTKNASVGIDIEIIRPLNIEIYKTCFDSEEWQYILKSPFPGLACQKLWVRKEAVIKADGRGMSIEMSSFNCLSGTAVLDAIPWYIQEIQISPEYVCAIACNHRKKIRLVNFNTVLEFENVIAAEQN